MTARSGIKEHRIWTAISILFLGLGINKQLDLQSAFTQIGRVIASAQGWYGHRQSVQLALIIFAAIVCVSAFITLLIWARHAPLSAWFALLGAVLVIGYVLIRAASFHHIDRFIGTTVLGLRWNWILEMGGIAIVLLASEWRRRSAKSSPALARWG